MTEGKEKPIVAGMEFAVVERRIYATRKLTMVFAAASITLSKYIDTVVPLFERYTESTSMLRRDMVEKRTPNQKLRDNLSRLPGNRKKMRW